MKGLDFNAFATIRILKNKFIILPQFIKIKPHNYLILVKKRWFFKKLKIWFRWDYKDRIWVWLSIDVRAEATPNA